MTPRALSFFLCLTFLLPSPYLALRESQEDSAVSELARQLSAGLEEGAQQGREMRVLWEEMGRVLGGKRRVGSSRRYRALDFLSAREEETLRNFLMAPFSWERARTDLLPPTRIGEIRQILKRPPERFRRYEKGETTPEVLPRLARVILMIGAREGGKIPANTDVDPRHLDQFRSSRYWDRESGIVARRFRQSLMERIQRALAPYQDHRPVDTSPEAFEEAYAAIEAAIKKQPQLSSGASPALGESQEERPRNDQSRQELGDLRGQWQQLSKEVVEQIIELARRKGRAQEPISQATGGRLRLEDRTQKKGNLWSGREDLQWTDLKQRLEEGYFGLNVRFEDLPFSKRRSGSPQKKMVLQVTSLNKEKREIPTRIMALRDLLAQLPALGLLSGLEERLAVALEQSPVLELREGLLHAPNGETIRMPGAEELPQEGILVAVKGPWARGQAQGGAEYVKLCWGV